MPLILTDFAPENFKGVMEFFLAPIAVKDFDRKARKGRKEERANKREAAPQKEFATEWCGSELSGRKKFGVSSGDPKSPLPTPSPRFCGR
jgi:hypothetical protein